MKNMKPVDLRLQESLPDGVRLCALADQWSELLPPRIPLRYAIFRYLGFYVATTTGGKTSVLKSRQVGAVCVTIRNEHKQIFSDRVGKCFVNGVYYVQDLHFEAAGVHTVTVTVDGALADRVAPLVLRTEVHEFMELSESPELAGGVYAPLRAFVHGMLERGEQEQLRDDAFIEAHLKSRKYALRNMDAKWWLRAFVEQALDREARRKQLQQTAAKNSCRTSHKRKQDHPSRAADKREHEHLFERRKREWKRVRNGELRMFTTEPLYAGATVTVYSAKQMYKDLSVYAQV
ncbi:hypothetical protein PybrP1_006251 [[Pythium] brassicae (nom. inval.)]|nr:hypothetical protein PybrP1_006251 [[Pythium] brassicae (nom. inval.)]